MRFQVLLSSLTGMMLCLMLSSGREVMSQQGYGDDANTMTPAKIWKELPESFRNENRKWQGVPSIAVTSNRQIWVTWFSGGPIEPHENNYVVLATSGDKGDSWSNPIYAIDPQDTTRASGPSLWYDPTGRLWQFWHQSNIHLHDSNKKLIRGSRGEEMPDCRGGVWCMTTTNPEAGMNATWTPPRRLSDGYMLNKPIVDSHGQWLFPVAVSRFTSRYPVNPDYVIGPNVFVSKDQGQTLTQLGHSKLDRKKSGFDEHHLVELSDGRLWLITRTLTGIGEAFSSDQGKTWTDIKSPQLIKQTASRVCVTKLKSGNILLIKNGPLNKDIGRVQITAFLSGDDGKSWTGPLTLDERKDVTYPNAAQAPDGTIYAVYDHGRHKEKEILMARFTEEDVKQGKIVSDIGKLKIVVNKAGK